MLRLSCLLKTWKIKYCVLFLYGFTVFIARRKLALQQTFLSLAFIVISLLFKQLLKWSCGSFFFFNCYFEESVATDFTTDLQMIISSTSLPLSLTLLDSMSRHASRTLWSQGSFSCSRHSSRISLLAQKEGSFLQDLEIFTTVPYRRCSLERFLEKTPKSNRPFGSRPSPPKSWNIPYVSLKFRTISFPLVGNFGTHQRFQGVGEFFELHRILIKYRRSFGSRHCRLL